MMYFNLSTENKELIIIIIIIIRRLLSLKLFRESFGLAKSSCTLLGSILDSMSPSTGGSSAGFIGFIIQLSVRWTTRNLCAQSRIFTLVYFTSTTFYGLVNIGSSEPWRFISFAKTELSNCYDLTLLAFVISRFLHFLGGSEVFSCW